LNEDFQPVRSYQRIFTPQRRIHQIEGHPLPVPGGVPLRWLGWAIGALAVVIALASGSPLILAGAAAVAGAGGLAIGDRTAGLLAAAAALASAWLLGALLGALDWPLRLVVIPAAVASVATQATPDGRRPERFALSWLALRLAPPRRSLGRGLPAAGVGQPLRGELWAAPDDRGPRLRRARIEGPATVHFAAPVALRRSLWRRRRLIARQPARRRCPDPLAGVTVALREGEALEVRR
jgi:hypothetical protein